ncbi:MAG: type II CAAX endopeptidase family protein [Chloroflexota bacterium]
MNTDTTPHRSPWKFILLVFMLSIPFWLAGTVVERFLPPDIPINLPFSALMFLCPFGAAVILTYRENGWDGVKQLLKRIFDYKRIKEKVWYFPIFLLMPTIFILEYGVMKMMGVSFQNLRFPYWLAPVFFVMFFIGGACEEIGWSGYALEPLQDRWGALGAGLILGTVWGVWHIIPDFQAHNPPMWVLWQTLFTVANRVLIVWIYNNTGKSLFAAICFHVMYNVCWSLYPNYGSYYDPFLAFVFTAVVAVFVGFLWDSKTLARYRYA